MLRHYFNLSRRVLLKNKYYTLINIVGLTCGMLSALIIAKYIGGSLNYDSFHLQKDRIFRLTQVESTDNSSSESSNFTYWGIGEIIKRQYPEILRLTRYNQHAEALVFSEDKTEVSFNEDDIFIVDSNFLKTFTFPMIYGSMEAALNNNNNIVLTESKAKKYFGNTNPIGKQLTIRVSWGAETLYKVSGVIKDIPKKSQFKLNFLITQPPISATQYWDAPTYKTFLLLKETTDIASLTKKLTDFNSESTPLELKNKEVQLSIQSFAKVKLTNTETLLVVIGIFIFLITWVNFINQIIAQSYERFKEVGILRTNGAKKIDLIKQFLVEGGIISFIVLLIITISYIFLEPFLQSFTDGHLLSFSKDSFIINFGFALSFLIGVILSAAIPSAVFFSRRQDSNLFKEKISNINLRKALVIFQFSISIILVVGIIVVSKQLNYMSSKDKGIAMNNTIIVKAPKINDSWDAKVKKLELFKNMCSELTFIEKISSSSTVPSEEYRNETQIGFPQENKKTLVYLNGIDDTFFDLYNVRFISGNNFIPNANWTNKKCIILTESTAHALGVFNFEKLIGEDIVDYGKNQVYKVIAVIKDYHKTSLKYAVKPMAFQYNAFRGHFSLKIQNPVKSDKDLPEKLSDIKAIWDQVYTNVPFDYYFLEKKYSLQIKEDIYFGKLFNFFTILSIIISCIGLFGLSLVVTKKRNMEIGIRKVFGASVSSILSFFIKEYLGLISISVIIGIPFAYFLMDNWLRSFSYRITITFWSLILAVFLLSLIFIATVSYHTVRASVMNPVKTMQDL